MRAHGETGWTAHLILPIADGLIWASSVVMLDSARQKALARWLLGWGIAATLAAIVTHGPRPRRLVGAVVGA